MWPREDWDDTFSSWLSRGGHIVMRRRRQNRIKNFKRHHWLIDFHITVLQISFSTDMPWRHGRDKAVYGPDRLHQQETKEIRDYWQNDRKTKRQIFWIIVYFAVPVVQPLEQRPVTMMTLMIMMMMMMTTTMMMMIKLMMMMMTTGMYMLTLTMTNSLYNIGIYTSEQC